MRAFTPAWILALAATACADAPGPRLVDLEGPRRQAEAPGPWRVVVVAEAGQPQLFAGVDDAAPAQRPLRFEGGVWVGSLPAAEAGSSLTYYATLGDERLPPSGGRVVPVRAPAGPVVEPPPPTCALQYLSPVDGARLTAADDQAPQAGLQVTVTAMAQGLADGEAVRLRWGALGAAARVVAGEVAFPDVTLGAGRVVLALDAQPAGGERCAAEVTVQVSAPP